MRTGTSYMCIIFQSCAWSLSYARRKREPQLSAKATVAFFRACVRRVDNIKKLPEGFFTRRVLWAACLHFSIGRKLWICDMLEDATSKLIFPRILPARMRHSYKYILKLHKLRVRNEYA